MSKYTCASVYPLPSPYRRPTAVFRIFRGNIDPDETSGSIARGSYAPAANVAMGFELRDRTDLRADLQ